MSAPRRRLLVDAAWLAGGFLAAAAMLGYLHGAWQPWRALAAGLLGAVLFRRLVGGVYARFPDFLRFNFDLGAALLGLVVASLITFSLYRLPYLVLRWQPAVALLGFGVILTLALALLFAQQSRFEREIATRRGREAALREEALQARLRALQAQINPHFLFNAFNALAELTHRDADRAELLVQDLAHLLRHSLRASAAGRVTLATELEAVDRYLRVERARLGDRLRVERELAPGVEAELLPGLVLQPLVENAVRHAVAPRAEGGRVRIEARVEGDRLLLAVADDGPGLPAEQRRLLERGADAQEDAAGAAAPGGAAGVRGAGANGDAGGGAGTAGAGGGLANVRQRLALATRGAAVLRCADGPGCRLELSLPREAP
ncbi:MAG: histidine kinase [Candidatus Krumholzibacteriota bacterium]|nr:histidine kinase [Candidatus Krumholzibacteriota bacterium]